MGGAALLFTEMTDVAPEARISPGCAGMYRDEHVRAWKRIVDFVHARSHAKIALQLGHAGPKGSTQLGWEQPDEPLPGGNWSVIAPSPVPYGPRNQVPRAMTRADLERVMVQFVRATEMALECGFDMVELHCAHGYLLSAFITALTNRRDDEYGGSLENRLRYPLDVFRAMRAAWPQDKPMAARISATDWVADGIGPEDAVQIAQAFKDAGCDLIDVSTGQTSRKARPVYGRMFQTPFADQIRNEVGIASMAVGNIFEPDQVNGIIAARPRPCRGSSDEPTMAKKISVDSTANCPPTTMGLPKSAMLSMKPTKKALARPGLSSGSVTLQKVCMRLARSVCAASSMDGLTPCTTPRMIMKAMGVKANSCASQTPKKP